MVIIKRTQLKKEIKELCERFTSTPSFSEGQNHGVATTSCNDNENFFLDIEIDLKLAFDCMVISSFQEKEFTRHYLDIFEEASSLNQKLIAFGIKPPEAIAKLISEFEAIQAMLKTIIKMSSGTCSKRTRIFSIIV